eukprot:2456958-Prymnesium_polylepis.2
MSSEIHISFNAGAQAGIASIICLAGAATSCAFVRIGISALSHSSSSRRRCIAALTLVTCCAVAVDIGVPPPSPTRVKISTKLERPPCANTVVSRVRQAACEGAGRHQPRWRQRGSRRWVQRTRSKACAASCSAYAKGLRSSKHSQDPSTPARARLERAV